MKPCLIKFHKDQLIQEMQISLENDRENHSVIKHYIGMSMNQMRHLEVDRIIEQRNIKTFIDLGCSEALLIQKLSRSENIELAVGVDRDSTAVSTAVLNTFPENIQQSIQFRREHDQHLFIYRGDATCKYWQLKHKNVELITLVQLVEHLIPEDIPKLLENVFGYLQPPYCFISTPNKEFNEFFEFEEGQMRHWDHKFEWTRAEFLAFCEGVKSKYGYEYILGGIGEHITDDSKGYCTQYALFSRPCGAVIVDADNEEQNDLEERAHYQNKSWRNNKEKIMRGILFKSLYYQSDITFDEAAVFIKKEPIGACLQKDEETIDRELILNYLQQNSQDFEWDDEKYRCRQRYSQSEAQDVAVGSVHSQHENYGFDESAFSNELSISKSNIFEREEPLPIE